MIQCPYCAQQYKNSAHIHHHIAVNHPTEPKKFVCVYCGQPFINKRYLSGHENHCPKATKNICFPENHPQPMVILQCPYCVKTYLLQLNMSRHIQRNHPEKVQS